MNIQKTVITAGGIGTRFLPLTKTMPKEMMPVVDKPVIQYVVEEAIEAGLDDILIITGRGKSTIEDYFDISFELESKLKEKQDKILFESIEKISKMVDIHYIRQKEQKGLGDAILLAKKHVGNEPFAVLLGDTITISDKGKPNCTNQMISAFRKYNKSIIVIEPVEKNKIQDYGIINGKKIDEFTYEISDIIEKPFPEQAPSNLGAIGRYILTPEIFDHLNSINIGYGNEYQLTDALKMLDKPIGLVTTCRRYDIGDKIGWMKSNLELILESEEFSHEFEDHMRFLLSRRRYGL